MFGSLLKNIAPQVMSAMGGGTNPLQTGGGMMGGGNPFMGGQGLGTAPMGSAPAQNPYQPGMQFPLSSVNTTTQQDIMGGRKNSGVPFMQAMGQLGLGGGMSTQVPQQFAQLRAPDINASGQAKLTMEDPLTGMSPQAQQLRNMQMSAAAQQAMGQLGLGGGVFGPQVSRPPEQMVGTMGGTGAFNPATGRFDLGTAGNLNNQNQQQLQPLSGLGAGLGGGPISQMLPQIKQQIQQAQQPRGFASSLRQVPQQNAGLPGLAAFRRIGF